MLEYEHFFKSFWLAVLSAPDGQDAIRCFESSAQTIRWGPVVRYSGKRAAAGWIDEVGRSEWAKLPVGAVNRPAPTNRGIAIFASLATKDSERI